VPPTSEPTMTTTSYAVLGLLAIRPWTTYELIQQVEWGMRRFWPRARSKLYEEPKKLVALGYATAHNETVGRRNRTRYTITPPGRVALAEWLRRPGDGPVIEFEQLLKVHLADSGTTADVLATLAATTAWVRDQNEANLTTARAYLARDGELPERTAVNVVTARFLTDFYATVAEWAQWATKVVETWPDDPRHALADRAELAEILRRAEAIDQATKGDDSASRPASEEGDGRREKVGD
jgi:DNA-binding PadR family transcriptional regulator